MIVGEAFNIIYPKANNCLASFYLICWLFLLQKTQKCDLKNLAIIKRVVIHMKEQLVQIQSLRERHNDSNYNFSHARNQSYRKLSYPRGVSIVQRKFSLGIDYANLVQLPTLISFSDFIYFHYIQF